MIVWPIEHFHLGTLLLSFGVTSHVLEQRDRAADEISLSKDHIFDHVDAMESYPDLQFPYGYGSRCFEHPGSP